MATASKKAREQMYREQSKKKFDEQRSLLIKPNLICVIVELVLFIILMIMDGPNVIFDSSSLLFSVLLIVMIVLPLISLLVVFLSKTTAHLLITMSINQLCVFPLIIGYFVKYEDMKNCSSYHMLIFYFFFFMVYLAMTTYMFNHKSKFVSLEEK